MLSWVGSVRPGRAKCDTIYLGLLRCVGADVQLRPHVHSVAYGVLVVAIFVFLFGPKEVAAVGAAILFWHWWFAPDQDGLVEVDGHHASPSIFPLKKEVEVGERWRSGGFYVAVFGVPAGRCDRCRANTALFGDFTL